MMELCTKNGLTKKAIAMVRISKGGVLWQLDNRLKH